MRNKYLVKLYVKLHYLSYYMKHPKTWWQMRKVWKLEKEVDMIDNEHDRINFTRLGIYGSILAFTVWFWYSVFTNGLLVSVLWLVVLAGIIGICINMWDMRA